MIRTFLYFLIAACFTACNPDKSPAESTADTVNTEKKTEASGIKGHVIFGKYGCTASKYVNGSYEYQPKGSFTLESDGTYNYLGFEKPSTGTFTVDEKAVIHFKGGYFDGGEATPIEGRENRYYVVFPANPDNRWTAGLM